MGQGRRVRAALGVIALAGATLTGCEPWRQAMRNEGGAAQGGEATRALEDPSFARPPEMQGFFKSNRSSGTWSQEAREIEESLGAVNR